MDNFRRRVENSENKTGIPAGQAAELLSVAFYNYNTKEIYFFKEEEWPPLEYLEGYNNVRIWYPIGIVVVPGSHHRYGDDNNLNGVMSLGCSNGSNTVQSNGNEDNTDYLASWRYSGASAVDNTHLSNYTLLRGAVIIQMNEYSNDYGFYSTVPANNQIYYPYETLDGNTIQNVPEQYVLSDCDGFNNTEGLTAVQYLGNLAHLFSTRGVSRGNWYMPAAGELAYLPSIRYRINDTLQALNIKYGNVASYLNMSLLYWTSNEYDIDKAWAVYMSNGYLTPTSKTGNAFCRWFTRL